MSKSDSIFSNTLPRLPIQVLIRNYLDKKDITREKFVILTGQSKHVYDRISANKFYYIERYRLLCICIGLNLSLQETSEWMRVAGYIFSEDYPCYIYEYQIILQFKSSRFNASEAIYQILLLYGKIKDIE